MNKLVDYDDDSEEETEQLSFAPPTSTKEKSDGRRKKKKKKKRKKEREEQGCQEGVVTGGNDAGGTGIEGNGGSQIIGPHPCDHAMGSDENAGPLVVSTCEPRPLDKEVPSSESCKQETVPGSQGPSPTQAQPKESDLKREPSKESNSQPQGPVEGEEIGPIIQLNTTNQSQETKDKEIGPPIPGYMKSNVEEADIGPQVPDSLKSQLQESTEGIKPPIPDHKESPVKERAEEADIGPPVPDFIKSRLEETTEEIGPPIPDYLKNRIQETEQEEIGPPVPDYIKSSLQEAMEEDEIGPPVPGYIKSQLQEENRTKEIGPPIPDHIRKQLDDEKFLKPQDVNESKMKSLKIDPTSKKAVYDSDEDEDSDDDSDNEVLPTAANVSIHHGGKPVVALAVDPAGARLASGSVDYDVRFWDFAGMDNTLQSFRSLTPCGNNPIKTLDYSATGDAVLVISGMSQAKVLDRDGHEVMECVKGDQYISDMSKTKGHIAPLTDGSWHPRIKEEFLTCSEDTTCRLWDVKKPNNHKGIMKCRAQNGLKTCPTACSYSRDGILIGCVCLDGSIQMWDHRKMFVNTAMLLRNAHQSGTETSCIEFSYAKSIIATRGGDDTLKLWDMRAFKKPINEVKNLFSRYPNTNCAFSPNDTLIVTGVSLKKGETEGKLYAYSTNNLEKVNEIVVGDSHVIRTLWHPRLHQMFVGCGDGIVKAYFSESKSVRGAMLCAKKVRKKSKHVEVVAAQQIITPHALPMFRQDKPKSLRKQMEKDRLDPVKSHRPDLPIKSGQGGRVAASGSTLSSYVIRNLGLSKRIDDDQDPREAILRYAKDAAENPYWISPAYQKTQPNAIFQQSGEEEEPANKKQKM